MVRFLRLFVPVILAVLTASAALAAEGESALDRIRRTGVLLAGTRDDAPPFAFRNAEGRLVGFSVDIIEEVRKALAKHLGRDVRTETLIVTTQTRLETIRDHRADLVCETATMTWPR